MEAQPYYQPPGAENAPAAPQNGGIRVPRAMWGLVAGMVIATVLLVALPVTMIVDRGGTQEAIRADQPNLDPAHLDFAFYAVIAFAVVLHALDVVLTVWFGLKAMRGRQWARIALTVTLVVLTIGSLFSAAAVPTYLWAVIPGDGIHILMLILLWAPPSVREFFAAHRRADAASSTPHAGGPDRAGTGS